MNRKLWIIGDSFASCGDTTKGEINWTQIVSNKFKGKEYQVSSRASRDFQTILDIFLRNLKNISKDDFVILIVPSLGRVRLPLQTPKLDVVLTNRENEMECNVDYFMGQSSYINNHPSCELEPPLTDIDKYSLIEKIEISSIINASNASKNNYLEIIESLKSYLPFEIFVWSWDSEIESELVLNKQQITQIIGYWHTFNDLYEETNHVEGQRGDAHFSPKMHKAFADYIIVNFPQFFNT